MVIFHTVLAVLILAELFREIDLRQRQREGVAKLKVRTWDGFIR